MTKLKFDSQYARKQFPSISGWSLFDNAAGTLAADSVIARLNNYLLNHQVQPKSGYPASDQAGEKIDRGVASMASFINAPVDEVIVGPSTTSNLYFVAQSFIGLLRPGEEIIITNLDHEANRNGWLRLAERGIKITTWEMNRDSLCLEISDLAPLIGKDTRLLCFSACSNITGGIQDFRAAIALAHQADLLVCVDAVAYAPHRRIDIATMQPDLLAFSPYKVFGPHTGVLYVRKALQEKLAHQNHFFLNGSSLGLMPSYPNHELTAALTGIIDYFDLLYSYHFPGGSASPKEQLDLIYELSTAHETALISRLLDFLCSCPSVRIIGDTQPDPEKRVSTLSFVAKNHSAESLSDALSTASIGASHGHFYAYRLLESICAMGSDSLPLRISMAHYNTLDEVDKLCTTLEPILYP